MSSQTLLCICLSEDEKVKSRMFLRIVGHRDLSSDLYRCLLSVVSVRDSAHHKLLHTISSCTSKHYLDSALLRTQTVKFTELVSWVREEGESFCMWWPRGLPFICIQVFLSCICWDLENLQFPTFFEGCSWRWCIAAWQLWKCFANVRSCVWLEMEVFLHINLLALLVEEFCPNSLPLSLSLSHTLTNTCIHSIEKVFIFNWASWGLYLDVESLETVFVDGWLDMNKDMLRGITLQQGSTGFGFFSLSLKF